MHDYKDNDHVMTTAEYEAEKGAVWIGNI
jgi:hypothetical protein